MAVGKTKLEQEKLRKRKLAETLEVIEATGQESEKKAAKWVIEVEKEREKKEEKAKAELKEKLWGSRRKKIFYNKTLLNFFKKRLRTIDWPLLYKYKVSSNEKGIEIEVITPQGVKYAKGIKTVGEPEYDLYGAFILALQTENLLDKLEHRLAYQRTKSGIILPNKKESEKWTKKRL